MISQPEAISLKSIGQCAYLTNLNQPWPFSNFQQSCPFRWHHAVTCSPRFILSCFQSRRANWNLWQWLHMVATGATGRQLSAQAWNDMHHQREKERRRVNTREILPFAWRCRHVCGNCCRCRHWNTDVKMTFHRSLWLGERSWTWLRCCCRSIWLAPLTWAVWLFLTVILSPHCSETSFLVSYCILLEQQVVQGHRQNWSKRLKHEQ